MAEILEISDEVSGPVKKARLSLLALTGLVCGLIGTGIPFLTFLRIIDSDVLENQDYGIPVALGICLICAPILGLFGLVAIMRSGGRLWGRRAAIWAVLTWPLVGFVVVGLMLGTGDIRWQNVGIWALLIGLMALFYSLLEVATQEGWSAPGDEDEADKLRGKGYRALPGNVDRNRI